MKTIKIHSITDLITNSSTTIFTYSDNSISALEEMVNEFLKTFGINKTCSEIFNVVLLSEDYVYEDYINELNENEENYPEGIDENTDIRQLVKDVKSGLISKPKWFEEVEKSENHMGYCEDNYIHIIPKEKEYEKLAELIHKFLYSTDHDGCRED